jgi:hypothetical protein
LILAFFLHCESPYSLSKVFERVLLTRLQTHTEENNILPNQQFGFRAKHSTEHQVQRIVKFIKNGFRQKLSTGMLLLDIEKAYDTVWHDGLTHTRRIKNSIRKPKLT